MLWQQCSQPQTHIRCLALFLKCHALRHHGVPFQFQNGELDNIMLLPHHTPNYFIPAASKYPPLGRRVTMHCAEDKYQLLTQQRRNNIGVLCVSIFFFHFFSVKRHKDSKRTSAHTYIHTHTHTHTSAHAHTCTCIALIDREKEYFIIS